MSAEQESDVAEQVGGLQQSSFAHETGGEAALGRAGDVNAALQQGLYVRLCRGAVVHVGVHGGGDHDRSAGGEDRGGDGVVRHAVRDLGDGVGGGERDDHDVGAFSEGNVVDA